MTRKWLWIMTGENIMTNIIIRHHRLPADFAFLMSSPSPFYGKLVVIYGAFQVRIRICHELWISWSSYFGPIVEFSKFNIALYWKKKHIQKQENWNIYSWTVAWGFENRKAVIANLTRNICISISGFVLFPLFQSLRDDRPWPSSKQRSRGVWLEGQRKSERNW